MPAQPTQPGQQQGYGWQQQASHEYGHGPEQQGRVESLGPQPTVPMQHTEQIQFGTAGRATDGVEEMREW
jgi:hypothetical protein